MSQERRGPRLPQVNLFARPRRGFSVPIPSRYVEIAVIAIVVLVWAAAGVAIALLFGWHPSLRARP